MKRRIGILDGLARWAGTAGRPAWHVSWHPWLSTAHSFYIVPTGPATVLGRVGSTRLFSSRATCQNGRPNLLDRSTKKETEDTKIAKKKKQHFKDVISWKV